MDGKEIDEKVKLKVEKQKNNKRNINRGLIYAAFIMFSLVFFLPFIISLFNILWGIPSVNFTVSEGERVAKIIKVSEKGLVWKTWEMEAVLTQGDLVSTYVWEFSIDENDPEKNNRLQEVRDSFESGDMVIIEYEERAGTVPWRSKTNYFIRGIR